MTIKEQNALDLKRKWKRFLKEQHEKAKTKKENQKAKETDQMVSQKSNVRNTYKQYEGEKQCLIK